MFRLLVIGNLICYNVNPNKDGLFESSFILWGCGGQFDNLTSTFHISRRNNLISNINITLNNC